ncbi:hypothetical protein AVEN_61423-1 [Araneus ventricosus]|uniref:Uncharacterized protein n=1 Tax=Araneus ventricosus TaxID=182803 RepID=A0A4Y2MLZ9_ARAVE|nr:hypothetical protein AVEN_61423-1 [Araneus ventricosus]
MSGIPSRRPELTLIYSNTFIRSIIMKRRIMLCRLVILKSCFEETRGWFWDEPRNFEQRSYDKDDTRVRITLSKHPRHTSQRTFGHNI